MQKPQVLGIGRIGRIIIETDAQEVVKAIKSSSYDDSVVGHLIDEVKSLLVSNFLQFECEFVSRICNRAAHELAFPGYSCNEGEEVITASMHENLFGIFASDLLADE